MLQTDDEIREMVALGRRHGVEVCLFVGPRANWDIGIQAASTAGRVVGSSLRGADQLAFGIEDVLHGVSARRQLDPRRRSRPVDAPRPHEEVGRPAGGLRAQDVGDAGGAQSRGRAPARRPGRDLAQPAGRPLAPADCGDSPGRRRGHRLLHREPGRFRRRRPLLRDSRDGARCGADLLEVRSTQLARRSTRLASISRPPCWRSRASACGGRPSAMGILRRYAPEAVASPIRER